MQVWNRLERNFCIGRGACGVTPDCPFCGCRSKVLYTTIFGVAEPVECGWECVSRGHQFWDKDVERVKMAGNPYNYGGSADPGPILVKKVIPDTEPDYKALYEEACVEIDIICDDLREFARRFEMLRVELTRLQKKTADRLARLDGTSV